MDETFAATAVDADREARARYARWDADLFQEVATGPGLFLWNSLRSSDDARAVLSSYLQLAAEAIGCGQIDWASFKFCGDKSHEPPASLTLTARCWLDLIPRALAQRTPAQRLDLLARTWNLCEGLSSQPAWVNRCVAAIARELTDVAELESFLVRTLSPLLAVAGNASFQGPFQLAHIDLSECDDRFLPGEMHCVGPAVLCIHDRQRSGVQIAVLLGSTGGSQVLGAVPCLREGSGDDPSPVKLSVGEWRATIGNHDVALPLLARPHQAVVAPAGFVAISAVDSQRLWVVDSP